MGTPTGRRAVKTAAHLPTSAITTTGNGTAVDLRGAREIVAILNVLSATGTTPSLTVKLQRSDTQAGTFTDIAGATFGPVTAVGRKTLKVLDDAGNGWVRAAWTVSGTTPSFAAACDLIALELSDTVLAEAV